MPPKPKLTKEQLIAAAFSLLRRNGESAVIIRAVAAEAGCSTQPVMSHFPTADALKEALYAEADAFHTAYIMPQDAQDENPMLGIGLRYIRFAAEEPHLFRFLFQSDRLDTENYSALIRNEHLSPFFAILSKEAQITRQQAEEAFSSLFLVTHGYASLLANNAMQYDEASCIRTLSTVFFGVIGMMKGGQK